MHHYIECSVYHHCHTICKMLAVTKVLKFNNFNSKAHTFRLFEWIYGADSFVPIDKWPVFEGNIIIRLVFQTWEAIHSLWLSTIVINDNNHITLWHSYSYIIVANMICKWETEKLCNENGQLMISTVHYNLAPKQQDLRIPRITVNVTGTNKDVLYNLTSWLPHFQGMYIYRSAYCGNALHYVLLLWYIHVDVKYYTTYQCLQWKKINVYNS